MLGIIADNFLHSFNEDITTLVTKQCESLHWRSNTNSKYPKHPKKANQQK